MTSSFGKEAGVTASDFVARSINQLISTTIWNAVSGDSIKPYFSIGAIGYGPSVSNAFKHGSLNKDLVSLEELSDNVIRMEDCENPFMEGVTQCPVWVEPVASGLTPMCEAINEAAEILKSWVSSHPDSMPPIVINITDGGATDGEPEVAAKAFSSISNNYGSPLMFNVHISASSAKPIKFPASEEGLPDQYAQTLFRMSSELTPHMLEEAARYEELQVQAGSRGFVYNADPTLLVKLMEIGTKTTPRLGYNG